jgi:hypothetical protein
VQLPPSLRPSALPRYRPRKKLKTGGPGPGCPPTPGPSCPKQQPKVASQLLSFQSQQIEALPFFLREKEKNLNTFDFKECDIFEAKVKWALHKTLSFESKDGFDNFQ